jgi:hypothetical protein
VVDITCGTDSSDYDCTDSILDASLVLTSAYCLYNSAATLEQMAGLTVTAGVSNFLSPTSTDREQQRTMSAIRIHPGFVYSAVGATQPDDVAVLVLSAPLDLSGPGVQVVALPSPGAPLPAWDGRNIGQLRPDLLDDE